MSTATLDLGDVYRRTADRIERQPDLWKAWDVGVADETYGCTALAISAEVGYRDLEDTFHVSARRPDYYAATGALSWYLGLSSSLNPVPLFNWNDQPERTKDEVVQTLREAAAYFDALSLQATT